MTGSGPAARAGVRTSSEPSAATSSIAHAGLLSSLRNRTEDLGSLALLIGRVALEWWQTGQVYNPMGHLEDPYALYRSLRERDPVHRSHAVGGWVLLRYEDVAAALRDARLSSDDRIFFRHAALRKRLLRRGVIDGVTLDQPTMVHQDPPDHTRLRALVQKSFVPRTVEALAGRIEAKVEKLLDELHGRTEIDLIADFAGPLPMLVIAELLGVPADDYPRFKTWSTDIAGSIGQQMGGVRRRRLAGLELSAYFEGVAAQRQADPRDDLVSALVHAEEAGDRLSRQELLTMLMLLLVAGNETTKSLIGNGMLALLRDPEQLERLRVEPELLDSAVEEMLRYDGPVQAMTRLASEDLEIGGRRVRRGEQLVLVAGSANRDPDCFPDPDRFDIARSGRGHLAFGLGRHFCVGAALARLEARAAIAGLLRRYSRMDLTGPALRWQWSEIGLRGLRELRLRVSSRSH